MTVSNEKESEIYPKSTSLGAITARIAGNPQDVTSGIDLHIVFFWWRAQFYFCKIKPKKHKMARIEDEQKLLSLYTNWTKQNDYQSYLENKNRTELNATKKNIHTQKRQIYPD